MLYKTPKDKFSFWGVIAGIILIGSGLIAVGLAEWVLTIANMRSYSGAGLLMDRGVVILALGYIALELELIRRNR